MKKARPAAPSTRHAGARAALHAWGGQAQMGATEALLWHTEVNPRLRSIMTNLMVFDRAPEWTRFRRDHQWLVHSVPRFGQRVVETGLSGNPRWVQADAFDLGYHLRRVVLPAPGTERQLLDLAQSLAMTPLERARPPWQGTLVEGLEGGRAAYVLKLHHAISDGLGMVQLMNQLLGAKSPLLAAAASSKPIAKTALRKTRAVTPDKTEVAPEVTSLWERGTQVAQQALDYAGSATRVLVPRSVAGSPILRRRSQSMRFDTIEFPLEQFKAAAKACQGTINDVLLAGLMGGWRRYHEVMGVPVVQMPIGFPVSVRRPGDPPGGNRFTALRYAAPVGETDPITRVRDVQQFLRTMRAEVALDVMVRLMPVMARLPGAAAAKLAVGITSSLDAQVSNVPGLPGPAMLSGARITHSWPFGPLPGYAMMTTMASHDGRCCIGINSDPAAVIDPELMTESLRAGMQELLDLAGPPNPPSRRKRDQ